MVVRNQNSNRHTRLAKDSTESIDEGKRPSIPARPDAQELNPIKPRKSSEPSNDPYVTWRVGRGASAQTLPSGSLHHLPSTPTKPRPNSLARSPLPKPDAVGQTILGQRNCGAEELWEDVLEGHRRRNIGSRTHKQKNRFTRSSRIFVPTSTPNAGIRATASGDECLQRMDHSGMKFFTTETCRTSRLSCSSTRIRTRMPRRGRAYGGSVSRSVASSTPFAPLSSRPLLP